VYDILLVLVLTVLLALTYLIIYRFSLYRGTAFDIQINRSTVTVLYFSHLTLLSVLSVRYNPTFIACSYKIKQMLLFSRTQHMFFISCVCIEHHL